MGRKTELKFGLGRAAADFLRNPDDPREATSSRATIRVDAFVLKFVKP